MVTALGGAAAQSEDTDYRVQCILDAVDIGGAFHFHQLVLDDAKTVVQHPAAGCVPDGRPHRGMLA
jgi:hypothetical protein